MAGRFLQGSETDDLLENRWTVYWHMQGASTKSRPLWRAHVVLRGAYAAHASQLHILVIV
jgi:hypothetical protein